ncbi:unnamed protein product [Paramecium sonneborni]|uniref:Uncharacterized protein n=1 Tax=Paramecium sonneborni TaxID=65129 RepID=A0A8S1M6U0_9CILI|nr:unnamed protein product [Paramecium sonneborni]
MIINSYGQLNRLNKYKFLKNMKIFIKKTQINVCNQLMMIIIGMKVYSQQFTTFKRILLYQDKKDIFILLDKLKMGILKLLKIQIAIMHQFMVQLQMMDYI